MKNLTVLLLAFILLIFGWGCHKEKYDKIAPAILVNGKEQLTDTFKLSVNQEYAFQFTIADDRFYRFLSFSKVADALLIYNGKVINDNITDISFVKTGKITFRPLKAGLYSFILTVADDTGISKSVLCNLSVFENIPPIAILDLSPVKNDTVPYIVAFDASRSFDPDGKWGGKILEFEFAVQGGGISRTSRKKIEYVFPEAGSYLVFLKVLDSDKVWSEIETKKIIVN